MRTKLILFGFLVLLTVISGCATHYSADVVPDPYGFFAGIWHGMIFPFAVFVNLISWLAAFAGAAILDSIQIIGRPNTGFWYYVGFVLGMSAYGGGATS